jgi:hypothetical protein
MTANPEPGYGISFNYSERAMVKGYPYRPDITSRLMHLKSQRRIKRILRPQPTSILIRVSMDADDIWASAKMIPLQRLTEP